MMTNYLQLLLKFTILVSGNDDIEIKIIEHFVIIIIISY
jgi:hypothetical protein